jgi:hypothetical protein
MTRTVIFLVIFSHDTAHPVCCIPTFRKNIRHNFDPEDGGICSAETFITIYQNTQRVETDYSQKENLHRRENLQTNCSTFMTFFWAP